MERAIWMSSVAARDKLEYSDDVEEVLLEDSNEKAIHTKIAVLYEDKLSHQGDLIHDSKTHFNNKYIGLGND